MIEFVDPPPPRRGGRQSTLDFDAIAEALCARPGEWAIIRRQASHGAALYARRHFGRDFEVRELGAGEKRVDVYARYVGGNPDA